MNGSLTSRRVWKGAATHIVLTLSHDFSLVHGISFTAKRRQTINFSISLLYMKTEHELLVCSSSSRLDLFSIMYLG